MISDLVAVALSKHFGKNNAVIAQGTHQIDQVLTIHIKGTVKKAASTLAAPTTEIPLIATMALMLKKMGFQRDKAAEMIRECMLESLALKAAGEENDSSQIILERIADAETQIAFLKKEIIEKLPKQPKSGATTVTLVVNEIEEPVAA